MFLHLKECRICKCGVLTVPTGKAKTEKRRSLNLLRVLSAFFSGWRSFTAASPKNVICNNWNITSNIVVFSHCPCWDRRVINPSQQLPINDQGTHQIQKSEVLPRSSINKDSWWQILSILIIEILNNKRIPAECCNVIHSPNSHSQCKLIFFCNK